MDENKIIKFAHDERGVIGFDGYASHDIALDKDVVLVSLCEMNADRIVGERANSGGIGDVIVGFAFYQEASIDAFIEFLQSAKELLRKTLSKEASP